MGNNILSFHERCVIQDWHERGESTRAIARHLNRSPSTISVELNKVTPYSAETAHKMAKEQLSHRGCNSIITENMKDFIVQKLKFNHWSFEIIAHILSISTKTLYNWLNSGSLDLSYNDLPDKGIRRKRKKETRGKYSNGRSIEERPSEVDSRKTFGHYEADTILSGKTKGQAIATVSERFSRMTIVRRLPGRDSESMSNLLTSLAKELGSNMSSLTVDHGKEFSQYSRIESQANIPVYFAHAYSPHERGTNEQRNRVLRRFIPKGRLIEEIDDEELFQINILLNTMPLKCLNWRTPLEVFMENIKF